MHKYIFSTLLLSLSSLVFASSTPVNLEGLYDCNCTEVETNENSKGVMQVKKTGQTYSITSKFEDGSSYVGTGIYDQPKRNFSLVFINPNKPEETGLAVAEVKKDNSMTSDWTYIHKTKIAHSICVKRSS